MTKQSIRSTLPLPGRVNFLWNFAGKGAYAASRAVLLVLIAKLGTAEMVGQYALAFALTTPVFMMTDLDLRSILVTDSKNRCGFESYLGLRSVMTLLAFLIITVMACLQQNLQTGLVIFFVGAAKCFEAMSDMLYGLLQKHERLDRLGLSLMIKGFLSVLLMGVILWLRHSLIEGTAGLAAAWLIVLLVVDLPAARRFSPVRIKFNARAYRQLLRLSIPLGLVLLFVSLSKNISNYFIDGYMGKEALGYFSSIVYIMTTGSLVVSALSQSSNARLSKYFASGETKNFSRLLQKMTLFTTAMGAAMVLAAALGGKQILTLLYKPEYAAYVNIFILVMAAAEVSYISEIINCAVTATRQFRLQPFAYGGVLVCGLALSWVLIPPLGLTGAALCLLITSCLQTVCNLAILYYTMRKQTSESPKTTPAAASAEELSVQDLGDFASLDQSLTDQWKRLLAEQKSTCAFSDPDFLKNWWEVYGSRRKPLLLGVFDRDSLAAVFPLMIENHRFSHSVCLMGAPQATHTEIAAKADVLAASVKAVLGYLSGIKRPLLFRFTGIRQSSPAFEQLRQSLEQFDIPFHLTCTPSPFVRVSQQGFDDFYRRRFSSHAVKNNRRDEKRLDRLGAVTFRKLSREEMQTAFELHDKRWVKKIDTSGFTSDQSRNFFSRILEPSFDSWQAFAYGLFLDQTLIAFQYGFLCNDHALFYKSAHADLLGIYAPGKMIKRKLMRLFFEQSLAGVDLGVGYEEYKTEWTDDDEAVASFCFAGAGLTARLLFRFARLKSKVTFRLKQNRKFVLFKRNTLGRFRYLISPKSFAEHLRRLHQMLKRQRLGQMILKTDRLPKVVELGMPLSGETAHRAAQSGRTRPGGWRDCAELSLLMNCSQEDVIRRFYRLQACYLYESAGTVLCACWAEAADSRLTIADCRVHRRCKEPEAVQFLQDVSDIYFRQGCASAHLSVSRSDAFLLRAAKTAGFTKTPEPAETRAKKQKGLV